VNSRAVARPWQPPDGLEWEGNVPSWERGPQRRTFSTALLRQEQQARRIDRAILELCRRDYSERLRQYERLRRVRVRCAKPRHYTGDPLYTAALGRLTAPPSRLTTASRAAPPDPAAPGVYRHTVGHVVGVY
jgi:hypothetical protein